MRIIPLGGLGEVGKNMTVFEVGDERIVVDAGLAFPRDEHFGVDLSCPTSPTSSTGRSGRSS
jgi:ribonuclease J